MTLRPKISFYSLSSRGILVNATPPYIRRYHLWGSGRRGTGSQCLNGIMTWHGMTSCFFSDPSTRLIRNISRAWDTATNGMDRYCWFMKFQNLDAAQVIISSPLVCLSPDNAAFSIRLLLETRTHTSLSIKFFFF